MKGIICEEIGKFVFREDLPEPGLVDGEALVSIRRIGICGTDLHAYRGNQPYFTYPRVLGHELSGIIERIGDNPQGCGPVTRSVSFRICIAENAGLV